MSKPMAAASFDINAVTVKIPEFWADNARVWFAQTEAQFAVRGVTSSLTKFYYCMGALNRSDTAQDVDFIKFPPDETSLKEL